MCCFDKLWLRKTTPEADISGDRARIGEVLEVEENWTKLLEITHEEKKNLEGAK
jgi:hypothetical protein